MKREDMGITKKFVHEIIEEWHS